MAKHFHSASNKIPGTLHNHGLSVVGNSFQGSHVHFYGPGAVSTESSCLKALFLTNPIDDRSEVATDKPDLVPKACAWVLEHATFKSWASDAVERQLLWISGGSGMGKTMMSLFLLEKFEAGEVFRASQDDILLFYFIDMRNEKRNTAVSLLRGLVLLLLRARPALIGHILPDFEIQKETLFAKTSLEALWRIFASMLRDPAVGTVRCLIDGLDECQEDSLVRLLRKITIFFEQERRVQQTARSESARAAASAKLKLILVSREAPTCIPDHLASFPRISMSAGAAASSVSKANANNTIERKRTTTKPPNTKPPQPKLAQIVRLAMEKKKAGQQANPAVIVQNDDHASPSTSTAVEDGFAGLSLGHGVASQPTAATDQYIFDPPVGDDDEEEEGDLSGHASDPVEESGDEEPEVSQGSLEHYIDARVLELSGEMGYDESASSLVVTGLRSRGDGTFLWVDLAVDEIKRHPQAQVENVVDQLMPGIDNMYCQTLLQILPGLVPLTASLLRWVMTARRPMYLDELSTALTLMGFTSPNPREMVKQGIKACGPLLSLKEEDETIKLPHLSVKDFLTARSGPLWSDAELSRFYVDPTQVDGEISALCIRYLEQECLNAARVEADDQEAAVQRRRVQFPLLEYAVLFWADHLRSASHPRVDLSSPFFQTKSPIRKRWWSMYYTWTLGKAPIMVPRDFTLLHLAAYMNTPYIAYQLEAAGRLYLHLNNRDSHGSTPLDIAGCTGNLEMFAHLTSRGAKPEHVDGEDVFRRSCARGQAKIVNYILDMGYDVNKKYELTSSVMGSLKLVAMSTRYAHGLASEAMDIQRDHWSIFTADKGSGDTALTDACIFGHTSLVELLIQRGADVSIKSTTRWTAFHVAAMMGHVECVKVLLQHGADVLGVTKAGLTGLHCAAYRGKTPVISLLLDCGVGVDEMTEEGKTALHLAAYAGSPEAIQVLVTAGGNIQAQAKTGETPLHVAARRVKAQAVETLLALGADRHAADLQGKSPISELKSVTYLSDDQKEVLRILETFGTPDYMPFQAREEMYEAPKASTATSPATETSQPASASSPDWGMPPPTQTSSSGGASYSKVQTSPPSREEPSAPFFPPRPATSEYVRPPLPPRPAAAPPLHPTPPPPAQSAPAANQYYPSPPSSSSYGSGQHFPQPYPHASPPAASYQYPTGGQQQTQQYYNPGHPPMYGYPPGGGAQQGNLAPGTYLQPQTGSLNKRKSLLSLSGLAERAEKILK